MITELDLATRLRVAIVVSVLIVAVAAVYITSTVMESRAASSDTRRPEITDELLAEPYVVVRSLQPGRDHGHVAIVPIDDPRSRRTVTSLKCERVAATDNRGVCLQRTNNPIQPFSAVLFDRRLRKGEELPLTGLPSRARLSPDGRYAATTTFVSGHSYAMTGFSTETLVHDIVDERSYGNLEEFTFLLNGKARRSADLNVWGVTFVPGGSRFFATVYSQGRTYLVDGDLEQRIMEAVRVNAECPSLSPDGMRLVYKKRAEGQATDIWRFHVLDLRTGEERPLGESRSVDDQVAWLDERNVLYGVPERPDDTSKVDIWVAPIDGGDPRLFLPDADSPTVIR